jgi:serine/threonine protein kinase
MTRNKISHYKILEKLGSGGMGDVYKAEDTKLKRMVALKFLPPELTRDQEAKNRFVHEAQAASSLDHSNICTIYEIDETEDGQMFIAMACYEGETLKKKIERGPLPVDEAIDIVLQIAQGLSKAHEKGIMHRDIKPANILITEDGHVKIIDFGLAKLTGQTRLTKTGMTMGTVAYMSPEQARGETVDHRTDIWSLGVVLYEMITAQSPFKGEYEQAVLYSILHEEPVPLTTLRPDVPEALARGHSSGTGERAREPPCFDGRPPGRVEGFSGEPATFPSRSPRF